MTTQQLQAALNGNFTEITRVQKIPESVKRSFCNLNHCRPERFMVDPGQEMSNDAVIPGVPNRRLVFAEVNGTTAVVHYELGGFVGSEVVAVFDFKDRVATQLTLTRRPRTLEQLKTVVAHNDFVLRYRE